MKLRRGNRSENKTPIWLTVFSDMTTNLTLFFLILFAMTRMTEAQRQAVREGMERAAIGEEEADKRRTAKELDEKTAIKRLEDAVTYGGLDAHAQMEVSKYAVLISLKDPVLFPLGSAELSPGARVALEGLVAPLSEFPNDIVIEGHTDNIPVAGSRYRSNWELSIARAVSVVNFFTEKGLRPQKLVTAGYGEFQPLQPNDTEEGRARNRRIEITIVRQGRG